MTKKLLAAAILVASAQGLQAQENGTRDGVFPAGIVPIAPYSPGLIAGETLYVSGQIPHVDGAIPAEANDGENDVADQARIVLANIEAVLTEAGMNWSNVAQTTVYITDLSMFGEFNEVYGEIWTTADITPPARVTVEVSALPGGKTDAPTLIEISAVAVR